MVLDGHHLPPGTRVGISTWTAHHDPSIWGDDAEGRSNDSRHTRANQRGADYRSEFRPERWFNEMTAEQKVGVRFCGPHVTPR
jgi:cytochrome P450